MGHKIVSEYQHVKKQQGVDKSKKMIMLANKKIKNNKESFVCTRGIGIMEMIAGKFD